MNEQAESTKKIFTLSKSIPVKQGKTSLRVSEIELETDLRLKHLEMFEKRSPKLKRLIREGATSGAPTTLTPSEFIPIISVLTGLPENAVREISLTDLERVGDSISEILESFFGKPPPIGKKSRGA